MKKLIFIFSFIVLKVSLSAQLHYFLPRNNAVMSILDQKYWFEGDTIINGVRYTKIYRQKCKSETECGELSYYAAVREDTIGAKIYAVYPCDSARLLYAPYVCDDVLLADFDVHAGDQVDIYCNWLWLDRQLVTVDNVDSIQINNQYRKRINLRKNYWTPDSWVEGIGSVIFGLFFPAPEGVVDVGDVPKFLCLHLNNELLYQNPEYDTCFLRDSGAGIPSVASPEDRTYYSVTNDQLYIYGNYTCQIYNVRGFLISSGIQSSAMNISSWATGIYFIQLYDGNKLVYSGRFVKH